VHLKEHAHVQQNGQIAVIGIDIGKNSFHIVGLDNGGRSFYGSSCRVVRLRRDSRIPCPIGWKLAWSIHRAIYCYRIPAPNALDAA
jgi:hypothetical protein